MSTAESQPAAPLPSPRFQFSLRTLLLLFVLLGSSLGAFGPWGIANFALVVVLANFFRKADSVVSSAYLAAGLLCVICLFGPLAGNGSLQSFLTRPRIAAAALWLVSAGVALTWAVKSRTPLQRPPNLGSESNPVDRALSKFAYQVMLLIHGVASLVLVALLVAYFVFLPGFRDLIDSIAQKAELPNWTRFAAEVSPYLLRLLPLALTFNAVVLYMLGRLPRVQRWTAIMWFSLALVGLLILDALLPIGILSIVLRITTSLD